jgi:hypothetical protein
MLSRKHYVAIAAVLHEVSEREEFTHTETTINEVAERLAVIFKDDNPNFDRNRFLEACGL